MPVLLNPCFPKWSVSPFLRIGLVLYIPNALTLKHYYGTTEDAKGCGKGGLQRRAH